MDRRLLERERLCADLNAMQRQMSLFSKGEAAIRRQITAYGRGADGEKELVKQVLALAERWADSCHILVDRRWPGTRSASIDVVLLGPTGIFVLDAKNWAEPSIRGDTLWCGQVDATEDSSLCAAQRASSTHAVSSVATIADATSARPRLP